MPFGAFSVAAGSINRPDELFSVIDSQTGTTSYSYDAQGNLATRNAVNYTFDYGNRLRDVSGLEGSYLYDADGRRVGQTNSSGTIWSFYDHAGQLVFQQTRDGTTHDYLYLGGHLVAIRDYDTQGIARVMRYQHTDAIGSIIGQTDKNGALIVGAGHIYDPFGKLLAGSPDDGPGYTGHVQDASTGLTYMQQRYYDPDAMRFLSMDPVEANGTNGSNLGRYWYAADNPYRYTDPDGRQFTTLDCGANGCFPASKGGSGTMMGVVADANMAIAEGQVQEQASSGLSTGGAGVANMGVAVTSQSQQESRKGVGGSSSAGASGPSSAFAPIGGVGEQLSSGQVKEFFEGDYAAGYWDRYRDFVSDNAIDVGPTVVALAGGVWPKSWAPAGNGRGPFLGSKNPLTSVPRAFGMPGGDSRPVQRVSATIGLFTVGIGAYDLTIEIEGLFYAATPTH